MINAEQLHAAIRAAYPDADSLTDYIIQDDSDGRGPYLAVWNIIGPVPEGVPRMAVQSIMSRWEALSIESLLLGAKLVDGLAPNHRYEATVLAAIAATAEGEIVEEGSWTKEQASEVMGVWGALAVFLETPISEGGPTPLEVISKYA